MTAGNVRELEVVRGPGVAATLPAVLDRLGARRVLVVATDRALRRTGATRWLARYPHRHFADVVPNPQITDVVRGAGVVERYAPDVVVGVGGGSALDTAKAVRLLPPSRGEAERVLGGVAPVRPGQPPKLVLVPTTAGSGSEVTTFATIYVGTRKFSLDHPLVKADVALVDPTLTYTCPPALTAHCALDATAHAIESWWSVSASPASRDLARQALSRLVPVLRAGVGEMTESRRGALCDAAVLAGQAIDLTRTTAAHAFAYPTTAHFGVPHGLACALHLVWLLPLTLGALGDGTGRSTVDVQDIGRVLGVRTSADSGTALARLMSGAACPTRLGEVGVRAGDLELIVDDALGNDRTRNHPIALDRRVVLGALRSRL
ncbi:phosphonoacetaldehyde reductase [Umezawaea endophytica]|uniref:Phosphonoacetaldehyde reductase n=1 Tax=Umezawaea endophytica TaxID=1654476 RepID=A0A9X3A1B5_9PSEU|nr:phosphonoacetaldehyde reductase [Umezawaea endophytica]MCS7477823.1 phosphonoacetaldehyde reductase [Umezawaea endophytica]